MNPLYHPRLRDHEVEYAIKLRHTHDRIKSGILMLAGASTLYLQQAMNDESYQHLLRKAEETYREATRELGELAPPALKITEPPCTTSERCWEAQTSRRIAPGWWRWQT